MSSEKRSLTYPGLRGKESPMEIIALLAGIATIISTIVGFVVAVVKFWPRFAYWLQKLRVPKRSKKRADKASGNMTPFNLSSLRPRRRQTSFDQVVDESPPMRRPKAVWPSPYEKAVVDTDFMDRRPYPTTDSTRPFSGGGASPGARNGGPRPNLQSD